MITHILDLDASAFGPMVNKVLKNRGNDLYVVKDISDVDRRDLVSDALQQRHLLRARYISSQCSVDSNIVASLTGCSDYPPSGRVDLIHSNGVAADLVDTGEKRQW